MDLLFSVVCIGLTFIVSIMLSSAGRGKKKRPQWFPSLSDKHVLITGGSSGIGLAIALQVLEQGGFVTLISYSSSEIEDALQNQLKRYQNRVFTKVADVGNYEEISRAIKESFQWRPFDIVICNAGVSERGAVIDEASIKELDVVIRTNLSGVLYTVHSALPFMKQRGNRFPQSVVLIGSMSSLHPVYGHGVYTATKHAVKGMAECLRLELLPFNIKVTFCCPGYTRTPLLNRALDGSKVDLYSRRISTSVNFCDPKRLREPVEVAKATLDGVKEGSFLVVVGANKFEELIISTFSRGVFPAESIGRSIVEMVVFFLCRLGTHIHMANVKKIIRQEHMKSTTISRKP